MARPKPDYNPTPRILNQYQTAARLNWSENHFIKRRADLESLGFPAYDDFLGGWDAHAVEAWLDRRAGLNNDEDEAFMGLDTGLDDRLAGMKTNGEL